jgi:sortase A
MRNYIAALLFIAGVVLISITGWQFIDAKRQQKQSTAEAQEMLGKAKDTKPSRAAFQPQKDETIGMLRIPKINAVLPIIEGTDPDDLKKGVGHYTSTAFPGDHNQILLSGHRDTVFRKFGEIEKGDELIVELPYGTFPYVMDHAKIVPADDATVIGSTAPNEVLNVSTCYPFRFVGSAPDRYVIYAYPEEKQS